MEFNDAVVKDLGETGASIVFGDSVVDEGKPPIVDATVPLSHEDAPLPAAKEIDAKPSAKATGTRGNAYMLLYRRASPDGTSQDDTCVVPESLQTGPLSDNSAFDRLHAAYEVKKSMVELEVYTMDGADISPPAFFDLPQTATVGAATDAVSVSPLSICMPRG